MIGSLAGRFPLQASKGRNSNLIMRIQIICFIPSKPNLLSPVIRLIGNALLRRFGIPIPEFRNTETLPLNGSHVGTISLIRFSCWFVVIKESAPLLRSHTFKGAMESELWFCILETVGVKLGSVVKHSRCCVVLSYWRTSFVDSMKLIVSSHLEVRNKWFISCPFYL